MKIDFHVHFYPEKVAAKAISFTRTLGMAPALDGTRSALEESMSVNGIDFCVGMPVATSPENNASINRYAAANNCGRIKMFGSVHPRSANPADIVREIKDLGLSGVKVHPEYQDFNFEEPVLYPIWEKCIELDLPLLTHAGEDIAYKPPFHTSPARLAAFHRRFPELRLVAAHFGGYRMWDEVETCLLGSGVYLDISLAVEELPPERLTAMIRRHGVGKVLFATDSPWMSQKSALEKFDRLDLTAEERRRILSDNALALLAV